MNYFLTCIKKVVFWPKMDKYDTTAVSDPEWVSICDDQSTFYT